MRKLFYPLALIAMFSCVENVEPSFDPSQDPIIGDYETTEPVNGNEPFVEEWVRVYGTSSVECYTNSTFNRLMTGQIVMKCVTSDGCVTGIHVENYYTGEVLYDEVTQIC